MFRAHRAHHQERQVVSIQPLENNLCITLVIYQELLHDARSTKCKILHCSLYTTGMSHLKKITPTNFHSHRGTELNFAFLSITDLLLSITDLLPSITDLLFIISCKATLDRRIYRISNFALSFFQSEKYKLENLAPNDLFISWTIISCSSRAFTTSNAVLWVKSLNKNTSVSAYLQQSTSAGGRSVDVHDDAAQAILRVRRVRYSSLSTASATPFIQPHRSRTSEWHPRDQEFIRPLHSVRSSTVSLPLVPSSGFLALSHSLSTG